MFPLLKWLIGLKQLPQESGEGDWHLEFQSMPQGVAAVRLPGACHRSCGRESGGYIGMKDATWAVVCVLSLAG